MLPTERDLVGLENLLGGAIPNPLRSFLLTEPQGVVMFSGEPGELHVFGYNRVEPRLDALAEYGELGAGVLPFAFAFNLGSEVGLYLPSGEVIDLHGDPGRPSQYQRYGRLFRGEWHVISGSLSEFLAAVEARGLFLADDIPAG